MRPPRLADLVLRLLVRKDVLGDVIGDLHEEFVRFKLAEMGPLRAALWYWGQTLSTVVRLFRARHGGSGSREEAWARPGHGLADLRADLRLSVRRLARVPVFALSTTAILAFGIGIAATAFSAVEPILVEPLPYAEPAQLLTVEALSGDAPSRTAGVSPAEFRAYRAHAHTLEDVAACWPTAANLSLDGTALPVNAALVTPNLFSMLGVAPALGRSFRVDDVSGSVGYVALVSHAAWQRLFSSDPSLVGKRITLDGDPIEVVGIMPPEFAGPGRVSARPADFWVPMRLAEGGPFDSPTIRDLVVVGRLRDGSTLVDAEDELDGIFRSREAGGAARSIPDDVPAVSVQPLVESVTGRARPILLLALLGVGLVLAAVVTSVASMQLVRGAERAREFAVRVALGGQRRLLVRQLVVESLLLGGAGALGAVAVASWSTGILRRLAAHEVPRADQIAVSGPVVVVLVGLSSLVVLAVGLYPALRCTRVPTAQVLGGKGGKGIHGATAPPSRRGLVGLQSAVSVVLFVGAGLVLESYRALATVDTGFEADRVLTMATWLPIPNDLSGGRYSDPLQRLDFVDDVLQELAAGPEVERAAATSLLPLGGTLKVPISLAGPAGTSSRAPTLAEYRLVTEGYFQVLGMPVLAGRGFRETDRQGAAEVVVVSRTFAAERFGAADPIGRRVCLGPATGRCMEVVGVVPDVPHDRLGEAPGAAVYASMAQNGQAQVAMTFVLKTVDGPVAHTTQAVSALHRVDPAIPAFSVVPMSALVEGARGRERLLSVLFGVISVVTGLLAAMGIYGVVSSAVTHRRLEIGIRVSLGGARLGILRLLVGEGLWLGLLGVVAGVLASFGLGRLMVSLLPEVDAVHPGIVVGAVVLATSIIAAASLVPAVRAMAINPAQAVRAD